jgi:adenosylcobinamide kinase / adenosylcobinamide-phosphate guanylyltransferase
VLRRTTCALVEDRLLLDAGPDMPVAAAEAGIDLAGVRTVLVTHAHHDHLTPAHLLARSWAGRDEPLAVIGPAGVLDACRHWLGPHDPVELVEVAPGDVLERDGFVVRVLAAAHGTGADLLADEAVLYDVTAPDGGRLLHATDTGPLPAATLDAVRGAAYDVVLLEQTFGRRRDHGTGHLDLATFPVELARLREVGAVVAGTDVVAVHLSHHNPPGPELDALLRSWGARTVPDLTVLGPGPTDADAAAPHRTLLLGGARSGKSTRAEALLASEPAVRYVATGGTRDGDPEWAARVAAHRARRPPDWTTLETLEVADVLAEDGPPVLVDCLALWLTGVLDSVGAWSAEPGSTAYDAALREVGVRVDALVAAVSAAPARVVLVSNEVGSGVVPATASGRMFRDLLGSLNAAVATACDQVELVVAGRTVRL